MMGANAKNAAMAVLSAGMFLLISVAAVRADDKPAKPDTWKAYSYTDEGFSASYPSEPKKTAPKGAVSIAASVPVEGAVVSYTVRVADPVDKGVVKFTFDAIGKAFGEKLKSQKDIELKGVPGREMVVEMEFKDQVVVITQRVFINNKHMYQVMVAAPKNKLEDAQSKKFLDSFKILGDEPKP